jgi:hypothetical protein
MPAPGIRCAPPTHSPPTPRLSRRRPAPARARRAAGVGMSCRRRTRVAGCAQPAWTTARCQRRPRPHTPRPSEGRRVTETRAFLGTVEAALVASAAERASRAEAPGAAGIVGAAGTAGVAATRAGTAIRRGAAPCLRGDRGTWCTLRAISMPALGRLVAPVVGLVSLTTGVAERIGATRATAVGVAAASGRRRSGTCTRRPRAAEMCSPRTRRCAGCRRICAATTAAGSGGRPSRRRARTGRAPLEHRPTTAKTTAASGTITVPPVTTATTATTAAAAEIGT